LTVNTFCGWTVAIGGSRFVQAEEFSGALVPLVGSRLFEDTRRGFELMNRALKERAERLPTAAVRMPTFQEF
jgi:hypothetical protein